MDDKLAMYYKVLSNPVRLRVFMHIAEKSVGFAPTMKEESCITDISKTLNIPQPTASNHVKALKKAGLVKSTSVGTRCYHYVTKEAAQYLLNHTQYIYQQAHRNPY